MDTPSLHQREIPRATVADPGGGGTRGPCPIWLIKIGQKKMAAKCGLYFMFVPPPSEVSGSATEPFSSQTGIIAPLSSTGDTGFWG